MGSEARAQTDKLDKINDSMTRTADKTSVINARQKHLLR
jgi:hypothetical protein